MGDAFSVADAYLFVVLTWTKTTGIGLKKWPKVSGFVMRLTGRERVQEAMSAESLLLRGHRPLRAFSAPVFRVRLAVVSQ